MNVHRLFFIRQYSCCKFRIGDEAMKNRRGRGRFIFLCLAPAVILFIIFMIIPTIDVFRMSMFKWGGYTDDKTFVGLQNFQKLFQSCLLYTSDAADERSSVDLGGSRIIKKKNRLGECRYSRSFTEKIY